MTKKPKKEIFKWKQLASEGKLEEALVEFVNTRKHKAAIFPEIQKYFEKYMNTTGDMTIQADKFVILWQGLSEELASLINKLISEEKLFYHVCNPGLYVMGEYRQHLYLPPLTPHVKKLNEPHWLCTLISTEKRSNMKEKAIKQEMDQVKKEQEEAKQSRVVQPGQKPKEQRKKLILPS